MVITDKLNQDLKAAMLAGDKPLVSTLRGLKSAILYVEVAQGARDSGLPEQQIIEILAKESKKRQESVELYRQGGNDQQASVELAEKAVIDGYLPRQLSEDELREVVDTAIAELDAKDKQAMGKVIGLVKQRTSGAADGALIAKLVKERL